MLKEIKDIRETTANQLIRKMEKRQFEACYCATKEEALDKIKSYFYDGCSISCGGSASLKEVGIKNYLETEGGERYNYINRDLAKTAQEKREVFSKASLADFYLMSSNAITLDGELVNVDGMGNRVAALCFGPANVLVIASMNKVVKDVEAAIWRTRNIAAPPNAVRLNCDTPCASVGSCANCLKPDCICADIVVTRFSRTPGRIKVILVGEEMGY